MKLSPSILSADFSRLGEQTLAATQAGADYLHIDVMDGHFVPNISFGAAVMKSLDSLETAPYDVHLMIENPDQYISEFVTEKTEFITVHQEACVHLHRTIQHIKSFGIGAGVAINPGTPTAMLEPIIEDVDMILVMSVNPGFGGQSLIPSTLRKIEKLAELKQQKGFRYQIEIDGGVKQENIDQVINAGAEIIVAGSAVFGKEDIAAAVRGLKR